MALVITDYQVSLGTPPTATDGDTNRTAHVKLNAFYTAAIPLLNANGVSIAANTAAIAALGNSASKNIGQVANTVAAGDDSRFNLAGFRNQLINGTFDFWQRGTSFTAQGYTCDRFFMLNAGTTFNLSQLTAPLGNSYTQSKYGALCTITSVAGAANYLSFKQAIERVSRLAGKTVTVSLTAYAGVAGKKIGISLDQSFGTGGSPSSAVAGVGQAISLTTAPVRYSKTFTLASIAGKTLGSNDNDCTLLNLWLDAGASSDTATGAIGQLSTNVVIYDVQLEFGSVATDCEQRPFAVELAFCQRYYEKSFPLTTTPAEGLNSITYGGVSWIGTTCRSQAIQYKVTKRGAPTIRLYTSAFTPTAPSGSWAVYYSNQIWSPTTTSTAVAISTSSSFCVELTFTSGLAWGQGVLVGGNWTADAEL